MSNLLKAISSIVENPTINLVDFYSDRQFTGRNRINGVGKALEIYIQDLFADSLFETDEKTRESKVENTFSYQGNQNNPPDLILKEGDSLEIKKIQSVNSGIALNSSYPKNKLHSDSPLITKACRNCEEWEIKDIIYCIGVTDDTKLKTLWMVYGDCYAADREVYERLQNVISDDLKNLKEFELSKTTELGRVNNVDPLEITYLRIRGMWHIDNPKSVFNYIYNFNESAEFQYICILKRGKFNSFPTEDITKLYDLQNDKFQIKDVQIKDPNNPVNKIDATLISYQLD